MLMAFFMRSSISISLSMVCSRPRGRQRREFIAVVGRQVEETATPVGFAPLLLGGLDLVPARSDEVPPDVAGPSERRAAEDDEARAGGTGRDADTVPGSKHHHPAGLERLARDRDRPFDQVDAAILVIVGERQERTGLEIGIRVEGFGEDPDRRGFAIGPAEDQPDAHAVALDQGERLLTMMLEAWLSVLLSLRQGDPGLDAEQAVRRLAGGAARPLGVGDAAPQHHPVDSAGKDDLVRAQAVAVLELAAEEVGDGREANMGCGRTSTPRPETNSAGPIWSKKMNGPTIWRFGAGSARRTSKPPMSRDRGTIKVSMASTATASGQTGSSEGFQLISASIPANLWDCVKEG